MQVSLDTKALKYFIETEGEEFKLELRKAVISACAASYKVFITDSAKQFIEDQVRQVCNETAFAPFGTYAPYQGFKINQAGMERIRSIAKECVSASTLVTAVREEIADTITSITPYVEQVVGDVSGQIEKKITQQINQKMVGSVERHINEEVERRVAAAINMMKE